MPIYEYRCESCAEELEKIQKMTDPPLRECPSCGKPDLVKLVSASSFRLKGTGWYETDFKHKNKPAAADGEGKSAAEGAEGKETEGKKTEGAEGKEPEGKKASAEEGKGGTGGGQDEQPSKTTEKAASKAEGKAGQAALDRKSAGA